MKKHFNTLFFKVLLTVVIGICAMAIALSILNINASKAVYVETFVESQKKIFDQIDLEIYDFFQDVGAINTGLNSSTAVHEYLTRTEWKPVEQRANILNVEKVVEQLPLSERSELNLILLGTNGKTLNCNDSRLLYSGEQFLESNVIQRALAEPKLLICEYSASGFTDATKYSPVILMVHALRQSISGEVYGVAVMSIKEEDFCRMYSRFTAGNSDIIIFNQNNRVISSNRKAYITSEDYAKEAVQVIGQMNAENTKSLASGKGGQTKNYMLQRLQSTNHTMLGIIDPSAAFEDVYDYRYIIGVTGLISILVLGIIFLLVKQQTDPLARLVRKMEGVGDGKLDKFVRIEGTTEIRELSAKYNNMLVQLDNYIRRLMEAEQGKREAEIQALQMQINPHYIYNTLASVKWLIWQGEKDKALKVLDSFILLLRNTISNKQDMILLKQEIENLKNYVFINQVRYGEQVNVDYYIAPKCEECRIPKLILQPFIENAFFHAFPEGSAGNISIFAGMKDDEVIIEIVDDGVGIEDGQLTDLINKQAPKSEHFTGIGINNVDDRIKLIFGSAYGIQIKSAKGAGTTVTLRIPALKESQNDERNRQR